jgi:hypothetical protein
VNNQKLPNSSKMSLVPFFLKIKYVTQHYGHNAISKQEIEIQLKLQLLITCI